jgi:hypothetical protein
MEMEVARDAGMKVRAVGGATIVAVFLLLLIVPLAAAPPGRAPVVGTLYVPTWSGSAEDPNERIFGDTQDFAQLTVSCVQGSDELTFSVAFYGVAGSTSSFLIYVDADAYSGAERQIWVTATRYEVSSTAPGTGVIASGVPVVSERTCSVTLDRDTLFPETDLGGVRVWLHRTGGDRLPDVGSLWLLPDICVLGPGGYPQEDALLVVASAGLHLPDPLVLRRLARWKTTTGIPTYIVTWENLSGGRDGPEIIKRTIDMYYRFRQVRYAMLVGDSERLPLRYCYQGYERAQPFAQSYLNSGTLGWSWCSGGNWVDGMAAFVPNYFSTDLYYADLYGPGGTFQSWDTDGDGYYGELYRDDFNPEGIDYLPDVAVGRVPASVPDEVANYVTKIIAYESRDGGGAWFANSLVIACSEDPEWVDAGTRLASILSAGGFSTTFEIIPAGAPGDLPIQNALSSTGIGFLYYMNHGAYGLGVDDPHWLGQTDYQLPIIVHGGCHSGDFGFNNIGFSGYWADTGVRYCGYEHEDSTGCHTMPRECGRDLPVPDPLQRADIDTQSYIEHMLCGTSNRHAIAFLGSNEATQRPSQDMGVWFFEAFTLGQSLLGDMWRYAVERFYAVHSSTSVPGYYDEALGAAGIVMTIREWQSPARFFMFQKYHLFGDPSLRVGGVQFLT